MTLSTRIASAEVGSRELDALKAVISDEEILRVHGFANFGPGITPRQVVNDGVRKYAVGYQGGYTQLCILLDHKLITNPKPGSYRANLTQKGKAYARAVYQLDQARLRSAEAILKAVESEEVTGQSSENETMRAELGIDGNAGFALIGDNIQEGEAEFVTVEKRKDEPLYLAECRAATQAYNKLKARLGLEHLPYRIGPSHPRHV